MLGSMIKLDLDRLSMLFDFFYLCIFSLASRKAVLGQAQVSASVYSVCLSFISLATFLLIHAIHIFGHPSNTTILLIVVVIFGGNFIFCRKYFLRLRKLREILVRQRQWQIWKLKVLGILTIVLSFFILVFVGIVS